MLPQREVSSVTDYEVLTVEIARCQKMHDLLRGRPGARAWLDRTKQLTRIRNRMVLADVALEAAEHVHVNGERFTPEAQVAWANDLRRVYLKGRSASVAHEKPDS